MDPLGSVKEVIIVFVLILMNGLLAMLEMALVSSRKTRLEQLADEGNKKAAYILRIAAEDRYYPGRYWYRCVQRRDVGGTAGVVDAWIRSVASLCGRSSVYLCRGVGNLSEPYFGRVDTKKICIE